MGTVLQFKRKPPPTEWEYGCNHYGWLAFEVGSMPIELDIMWQHHRRTLPWESASAMRRRLSRIPDSSNS